MATATPRISAGLLRGPAVEPDRSVWRLLCFTGQGSASDEQLHAALPVFPLESLAAARPRVADEVGEEARRPEALTPEDLVAAASVTMQEVLAAGLDPHDTRGWAGLTIRTPAEHAAFFGQSACAPTS